MKTTTILLLLNFMLCATSMSARDLISFNQDWKFKKGPFPSDPVLFQQSFANSWEEVTLPHTWNAQDMQRKQNAYYAGEAYYKKSYTPSMDLKDKRVFLRFEGVASVCEVYVNGKFVGNHKGAFSAFVLEIGAMLNYGKPNELLIKVNNAPRPDVIPINNRLFGVYGGIYRPVELIVTDQINIAVTDYASSGIYITQKNVSHKSAQVSLKIKLENKTKSSEMLELISTIYERNGQVKTRTKSRVSASCQGRQFEIQQIHISKPHLWQGLEDPYLYKVVTQVLKNGQVLDEVTQPLGLRHYELRTGTDCGMYLNGKKVNMYGVCRHQDWLGYGSALSKAQQDTDLQIIKELGATTIRLAHYQQSEYFYSKCDSIGFLVWAEIPFVNRVSTQESDNAKQQLTELIRQNFNHPSIYTWGLHNEVYTPQEYTVALTTTLNDLAKTEDPDRYTVSTNGYGDPEQGVNLNADIQGINRYYGWYEKKIGDLEGWAETIDKKYPDYKIMLAEYGAEANVTQQEEEVGDVGRYFSQFYPETFATKFHEIQWGIIAKHPHILASYIWNTFDFATPEMAQGGVEARNTKGLVTFDRKLKKDPFYWYKANWSKEPVLYLTQRRLIHRKNQITPVTVYSNIGTPQLYVNNQEFQDFTLGTTSVHYIFKNIPLKEGKNEIVVKRRYQGKEYTDHLIWNYSSKEPSLKEDAPGNIHENKEEHVGL